MFNQIKNVEFHWQRIPKICGKFHIHIPPLLAEFQRIARTHIFYCIVTISQWLCILRAYVRFEIFITLSSCDRSYRLLYGFTWRREFQCSFSHRSFPLNRTRCFWLYPLLIHSIWSIILVTWRSHKKNVIQ